MISWSAAANLLVHSIPAHLMAYLPFRDRMRFPLWKVLLPVGLVQLAECALYGYVVQSGGSGLAVEYGFALFYMAAYFFAVRDSGRKLLFLYLFVTDYTMILWGGSAFLEARFFYDPAAYSPGTGFTSWTSVLLSLTVLAATAPFMLRYLASAREKVFSVDAPAFWRTAWLIPAFTTAIVTLFTDAYSVEEIRSFRFLFARVLLLLCGFVIYSILLDALDGIRRQAALEEQSAVQEYLLSVQKTQQRQLWKHMEAAKTARHDLRQHLGVIEGLLEREDFDGLKQYLSAYQRQLPADVRRVFCRNAALNVVCTYYAEEARKLGVDYAVTLDFPDRLPVSEPEVCALLGNLLENAVEACAEVRETAPFIRVGGVCAEDYIALTVDNSCAKAPVQENGRFRSAKREGFGSGTWSVRACAERHGGKAEFSYQDGVFLASVFLYAQPAATSAGRVS